MHHRKFGCEWVPTLTLSITNCVARRNSSSWPNSCKRHRERTHPGVAVSAVTSRGRRSGKESTAAVRLVLRVGGRQTAMTLTAKESNVSTSVNEKLHKVTANTK